MIDSDRAERAFGAACGVFLLLAGDAMGSWLMMWIRSVVNVNILVVIVKIWAVILDIWSVSALTFLLMVWDWG